MVNALMIDGWMINVLIGLGLMVAWLINNLLNMHGLNVYVLIVKVLMVYDECGIIQHSIQKPQHLVCVQIFVPTC